MCDKGSHPVSMGRMGGSDGWLDGGCPCRTGSRTETCQGPLDKIRARKIEEIAMAAPMGTNRTILTEVNRRLGEEEKKKMEIIKNRKKQLN